MSRTKKILIVIVVILAVVLLIYVYLSRTKKQDPAITPSTQTTVQVKTEAKYQVLSNYFLNTVLTQTPPVLGLAWNDVTLIYATPQGIFNANKNSSILKADIQKASFSYLADVLFYRKDSKWGYFNHITQLATEVPLNGNEWTISIDGKSAFQVKQSTMEIADLSNGNVVRQTFEGTITSYVNASPTDTYITFVNKEKKNQLVHINKELVIQEQSEISNDERVVGASPTGTTSIVTDNKKLTFIKNKKNIHEISFQYAQKLTTKWNPDGTIVVIEQLFPDELDRIIQNIWIVSENSYTATILTDTKPMPRRLATVQNAVIDKTESVIPLIERDGGIWLLSLIRDQFPALGEKVEVIPFNTMNESSHSD
jgi:hypothetical protein